MARFYAAASPAFVFNTAAKQVAVAERRSLAHNARALALLNMAISDSLVTSFATKYLYDFWRPETAIRAAATDGNEEPKRYQFRTVDSHALFPKLSVKPRERELRRGRGARGVSRSRRPSHHADDDRRARVTLRYTKFKQITADIDDARVYGGIHFRFDQEAGAQLGRAVGSTVYRRNLRRDHDRKHDREDDCDDHDNHRR